MERCGLWMYRLLHMKFQKSASCPQVYHKSHLGWNPRVGSLPPRRQWCPSTSSFLGTRWPGTTGRSCTAAVFSELSLQWCPQCQFLSPVQEANTEMQPPPWYNFSLNLPNHSSGDCLVKALPGNLTQAFPHVCLGPITTPVWSAKQEISTDGDCYQKPLKIKGLNP